MSLRTSVLGAASVLALVCGAPAFAQATPAESPAGIGGSGDIIVTARRVEERLQDVPISITAFSQQQLTSRNVFTTADLATYTPSLQTNNFFGTEKAAFSIRGFVQDNGTQPSVGVYFADVVAPRGIAVNVPAGDGAGPGSFFDLQNAQVLKGPQGTLFGRNTTGGAVLLVPQKPTDKLEGYVEGSYGNYDMKREQAVLNTPLGDQARFRIGVDHMTRDGYIKNTGGIGPGRFNGVDYWAVRASLVVDLTPDLENYTIVSYSRSSTSGSTQRLATCQPTTFLGSLACDQTSRANARGDGFYTVQTTLADAHERMTEWQIINTTTWNASDTLTIKNIVSYAQLLESYSSEIFGTQFDLSLVNPTLPANTFVSLATSQPAVGRDNVRQSTFTDEFRLQGTALNNRLTWQAGAYAEIARPLGTSGAGSQSLITCADFDRLICNNPIGAGGVIQYISQTTLHDYGVYGQGTYKLTDKLNLTGGIRYTWDRAVASTALPSYFFTIGAAQLPYSGAGCILPDLGPNCAVHYKTASSKPTWLIDLDYKPTRNILLYAKYARGYRAGNISPNVPSTYATFNPEKLDAYEVGLKTTFNGFVRGTFDVSAFYNKLANQQLLILLVPKPGEVVPPLSGIANAGRSRIQGLEASGSITPFEGFTFDGAYTYLDAKIKAINLAPTAPDSPYDLGSAIEQGDRIAFAPKNKFTLTATYTLPLDSSVGKISLAATAIHVDSMVTNYSVRNADGSLGPFTSVPPHTTFNLNMNWNAVAGTRFDVSLFANNVTDKKYYTFFGPLLGSTGFTSGVVSEPRMFGGRLRYSF